MIDTINSLYEELIFLDEIAGILDEESNRKTDERRKQLKVEIQELEKISSRWG